MIEFKKKYSMQNGHKVTRKNWQNVIAVSTTPNNSSFGWPEIDKARKEGGYFDTWKLVFEKNDVPERCGYIFREVIANHGINGHHKTYKQAIWAAMNNHIRVYLNDESSSPITQ
jgi:hypothetical protein